MRVVDDEAIRSTFINMLGASSVLTDPDDMSPFVNDFRGRFGGAAVCCVIPSNVEQVSDVVRECAALQACIVPQGGNTSLCEGAVPGKGSNRPWVVLNTTKLNRIRSIDPANFSLVAEAGCILSDVQDHAQRHGCLYGVSLGAEGTCRVGGKIATNAGGTGVLRYGTTRDNVLGLEVVLPDGRVWSGLRQLRKDNTGFDLKQIFIGSEGTVGVITAAALKLHPLPTAYATGWLGAPTAGHALDMLVGLQTRLGRSLSAYEVFNKPQLDTVISNVPGRRPPISPQHEWHILVELADTTDEVQLNNELQAALSGGLEAGIVSDAALAMNRTHRAAWWEFRHSVTEGNKRAGMGLTTDSAVAVSYIPEFIAEAMKAVRQELEDISINVVAHFGDGNVHIVPVVPFDKWKTFPNPSEFALRIKHVINQVAVRLGGTFSAEHGIGQALVGDMNAFKSPVELDLMRTVKRSLDPGNIFNPGRMLPQVEPTTPEIKTIQLL